MSTEISASKKKYEEIYVLPKSALTVKRYAKQRGVSVEAIYKAVRLKQNKGYKIVSFQDINFVIPVTEKART